MPKNCLGSTRAQLRDLGVVFRLGETVEAVERHDTGALIGLKSGKRIVGETVLYSAGRQGATAGLGLESIGVETDEREISIETLVYAGEEFTSIAARRFPRRARPLT